jgi:DNA transformation protein
MSDIEAFLDWQRELLGAVAPVSFRAMFGGHGVYADGVMIGLVADQQLYLKADDATRERFAAAGSKPFVYDGKGKPVTMSYWLAPDAALDDPESMAPWARLALEAARRAQAKKARGARAPKADRKAGSVKRTPGRGRG